MKRLGLLLAALVVIAGALYVLLGFRIAVDGSGMRPRFIVRDRYAELEANRARQREDTLAAAPVAAIADPAPAVAEEPGPAREADPPAAVAHRASWPDFRGPRRDGRYDAAPIRTSWPAEGLPLVWKQPIGLGYASFVAADRRAFTIEQRRGEEVVAAYDIETGRELWTQGWDGAFVEAMGGDGPRATPTYHLGHVYALGALGELRALDAATGAVVWRRNILTDNGASNLSWGMAASPLIVDDTVVVLPGGAGGRSVAAYDAATGAPMWTSQDDVQAYTAPMLVTLAGVRQILVVSEHRIMGLTTGEGRLLWDYPWRTSNGINVAQPLLLGEDRVFISAAYGHGAAVVEIARQGEQFEARTVWESSRMKNKFTSSVLHDGYIYGLDEAILACLDATTGELQWKGGRYGYGQLLLAGDHLVVITESGDLVLVAATPERHVELARFDAIDGKTWNHPIIADGRLLVRNAQEMAAFDIRP